MSLPSAASLPTSVAPLLSHFALAERLILFLQRKSLLPTVPTLLRLAAPLSPTFSPATLQDLTVAGALRLRPDAAGADVVELCSPASTPAVRARALRAYLDDHVARAREAWEAARGGAGRKRGPPFDAERSVLPLTPSPPLALAPPPRAAAPPPPPPPLPELPPPPALPFGDLEAHLRAAPFFEGQIIHSRVTAARLPAFAPPAALSGLQPPLRAALAARGIAQLYTHQAAALAAVEAGQHVVLSTPTSSGKSLAYLLPAFSLLLRAREAGGAPCTVLFLFPTKALAQDQLRAIRTFLTLSPALGAAVMPAVLDGDTGWGERGALMDGGANLLLCNPDIVHAALLKDHARWRAMLASLALLVVDEAHMYSSGLFGAHVALTLARLLRVLRLHGAAPRCMLCSATLGCEPRALAAALLGITEGLRVIGQDEDGSGCGEKRVIVWQPPFLKVGKGGGADDDGLGVWGGHAAAAEALAVEGERGGESDCAAAELAELAEALAAPPAALPPPLPLPLPQPRAPTQHTLRDSTLRLAARACRGGWAALRRAVEEGGGGGGGEDAWGAPLLPRVDFLGLVLASLGGSGGERPPISTESVTVGGTCDDLPPPSWVGRVLNGAGGRDESAMRTAAPLAYAPPRARRSALTEAAAIASSLVGAGQRVLVFCRARRTAELLLSHFRACLPQGLPPSAARVYRGGYMAEHRRQLEAELFSGALRCVVATNALELGVDIANVDAVVMLGFPGSAASFQQQCGRAGRSGRPGTAVLVLFETPSDALVALDPERAMSLCVPPFQAQRPRPTAALHLHLLAAAAESALGEGEADALCGAGGERLAQRLAGEGMLVAAAARQGGGGSVGSWAVAPSARRSAWSFSLRRCEAGGKIQLLHSGTGQVLEELEPSRAAAECMRGAVTWQQGAPFIILSAQKDGFVRASPAPPGLSYYTTPRSGLSVEVAGRVSGGGGPGAAGAASLGVARVTKTLLGYTRRARGTGVALSVEDVALPPTVCLRAAVWWHMPLPALRELLQQGLDPVAALHGAAHALRAAALQHLGCEENDIEAEHYGGGCSGARAPLAARIMLYEGGESGGGGAGLGGGGFAPFVFAAAPSLVKNALALVARCSCTLGCSACIASARCGAASAVLCKEGARIALQSLQRGA